jgi:hypothetical protein
MFLNQSIQKWLKNIEIYRFIILKNLNLFIIFLIILYLHNN